MVPICSIVTDHDKIESVLNIEMEKFQIYCSDNELLLSLKKERKKTEAIRSHVNWYSEAIAVLLHGNEEYEYLGNKLEAFLYGVRNIKRSPGFFQLKSKTRNEKRQPERRPARDTKCKTKH